MAAASTTQFVPPGWFNEDIQVYGHSVWDSRFSTRSSETGLDTDCLLACSSTSIQA